MDLDFLEAYLRIMRLFEQFKNDALKIDELLRRNYKTTRQLQATLAIVVSDTAFAEIPHDQQDMLLEMYDDVQNLAQHIPVIEDHPSAT
jgi:hypothetical protein